MQVTATPRGWFSRLPQADQGVLIGAVAVFGPLFALLAFLAATSLFGG